MTSTVDSPPAPARRSPPTASTTRTERVRPGMCGHNSLFVGQIGDWTWDAVSELCDTDVLTARDETGSPTYLSFYYYRVRGSQRFHLRTPSFGDQLRVDSRLFGFGSESVLTVHRIRRVPAGVASSPVASPVAAPHRRAPEASFELSELAAPDPDCLYVENVNRWVARSDARTNEDLRRSAPVGFQTQHLPALAPRYSPRPLCHRARDRHTFVDEDDPRHHRVGPALSVQYPIDVSRDLNGVGLLYFATYFSIVDWGLLRMWGHLGRTDQAFLDRIVVDQQLCYLGNADGGAVVDVSVRRWRVADDRGVELFDVVLRDRERVIAVCTLTVLATDEREKCHDTN